MRNSGKYYEESLYPLQNGVLSIVNSAKTPFFLTGGTALSRHYLHHRYSDDLDFFVPNDPDYAAHVDMILRHLLDAGHRYNCELDRGSLNKSDAYTQLYIRRDQQPDMELKVEFINDVAAHYGTITEDPVLGRIDSWQNILSNKLTALFRSEPKDVVDIHALALVKDFNWEEIVTEAKSKEAGIDPQTIYGILHSFPMQSLDSINWINRPVTEDFISDIEIIADDILHGNDNSLVS